MKLISANEWGRIDRHSIAAYDAETVWRLAMIQAFLVEEEPENLNWKRALMYHDLFWLVGPRLWARLLPTLLKDSAKIESEIGDVLRTIVSFNEHCIDAWESNYLLTDPFASKDNVGKRFVQLVDEFASEFPEGTRAEIKKFLGTES